MKINYYMHLPKTWNLVSFDSIAKKITCGLASTPKYVEKHEGMPFLSAQNVHNEKLNLIKFNYIEKKLHTSLIKNNRPEYGDLLYTRVGAGIGEAAIIDKDLEFSIYVSLTLIKCGENLNNYYLKYLLNSPYYKYLAKREQFAGGGVQNLNVQIVKKFLIPLPPLEEQKKITQILSTWDKAIETVEKLIENSKTQKKALMQQLLSGRRRFREFGESARYGKLPEGWHFKLLEKLACVERGKFSARPRNDPKYYGGDIPFVQTGDVSAAGTYLTTYSQTLNEKGLEVSKVFPKNTILMTIAANIGDTALTRFNTACPDSVVGIQAYQECADSVWLKHSLETYRNELDSKATQNAQKNINLQVLKPLEIYTPPLPEQKIIAKVLNDCNEEISNLIKQQEILVTQKKSLMQQLLTGKRRVKLDHPERTDHPKQRQPTPKKSNTTT